MINRWYYGWKVLLGLFLNHMAVVVPVLYRIRKAAAMVFLLSGNGIQKLGYCDVTLKPHDAQFLIRHLQ
jgi:hypothetical protein